VGHHAFAQLENFVGMALTASDVGNSQVTGIHESNKFGTFVIQKCVGANGIGGGRPKGGVLWLNVGTLFSKRIGIPAVAIGAPDIDCVGGVHVADIGVALNTR
jgi:hypothetical protein